jgi:hypothetical protein
VRWETDVNFTLLKGKTFLIIEWIYSHLSRKKVDYLYLKGFLKYKWDSNGLEATIDNTSTQDHCCLPHVKPDLQLNLDLRKATAWHCMTYQYFLALVLVQKYHVQKDKAMEKENQYKCPETPGHRGEE